ncbi:MAG: class I SAM-dependent methyltransferase [Labedaea sp.]
MGDRWAQWLLRHRFGDDPAERERMLAQLGEVRDKVLDGARIGAADVVLDVGCGDGLLGFGAVDRAGAVIFSDVSADLLDRCRQIATGLGCSDRCRFVHTGLPDLAGIEPASVDVVTTRSVLIYVPDKAGAFATFRRVLRPDGRLSIFEPINRFHRDHSPSVLWGFDVRGVEEIAAKARAGYRSHHPEDNPMVDFDERDLIALAEAAGFTEVHLEYRADVGADRAEPDFATWLRMAFNPLVPPIGEILDRALTPAELEVFTALLREQLTNGRRRLRQAMAYLVAIA